jgi:hypothetical protein
MEGYFFDISKTNNVSDKNINDDSEHSFELHILETNNISNKTTNINPFSLFNMDSTILVLDIKFLIQLFEKIPISRQKIYFNEQILDNNNTLGSYNIISTTLVHLEII